MATKQETVDFICEQSGLSARVTSRKMFGEFALYVDGKVIGLVCDDILYVKPTDAGKSILGTTVEQPPYKGATPHFCIAEQLEDRELLKRLFLATADALPAPKPKAKPKPPSATKPLRKSK
jgi:TfoX/Sxy family transcriptional regulator of competence genes